VAGDRGGVQLSDTSAAPPPGGVPRGTWLNRGERVLYDSEWVRLLIADVMMPDGTHVDHHVVRMPREAAGTVMVGGGRVLLMYRHRFITDTWGWEIPAGAVDEDESPEAGAIREALEESGWEPQTVAPLCRFFPANGVLGQTFHIFVSHDAVHRGEPTDTNESTRIEWFTPAEVRELLQEGEISDGLSFGAVTYALAMDAL
jgi:8-oxo-dGTP pyrophosphatase MutT (NUDIX family)